MNKIADRFAQYVLEQSYKIVDKLGVEVDNQGIEAERIMAKVHYILAP